jgi:endoglucanase
MTLQTRFSGTSLLLLPLATLLASGLIAQTPSAGGAKPYPTGRPFAPIDPFDQVKKMGRGVNIIGYDPLWRNFQSARFKERHFERIHTGGFQTVRVNLQAFSHMDAENKLNPAWFTTMDWVIQNSLANNLTVILDEHDYGVCGNNPDTCKPRLLAFWKQVAARYQDAPPSVVFEILNEPNGKLTPELWNAWIKETLALIRETNPTRTVIVGPAFWNNIHYLDKLELPEGDRHIIATVHYYLPMEFTHQGARWNAATANLSGVTWGTDAEKRQVEQDFAGVQAWSKAQKRPILLGEFGAYDKGEMESRVRYTAYVVRTAESLGWAWTYWQFDSDFIVYDMAKDDWVQPIWKALIP